MTHVLALPTGTELVGDYRIERVLGAGGFGITYLAEEMALERDVTIKEYFPSDFAARVEGQDAVPRSQDCAGDYQWGLDRFIEEAQTLAKFDHRNIVRVYRYFRANNTGYMVLHFEEGQSLKSWLKSLGRAPRQKEIDQLTTPLLDALELIHKADFLHRDIAPDNIIVRRDGSPVLIDFGSARGEIAQASRTVSALVKPGYSPYEQYAENGKQQGPWTDIYALGATLYHAITGKRAPDAPSRIVKDELVPAREAAISSYRTGFLAAIDRALMLDIEKRPQSIAEWRGGLLAPDPARPNWLQRTIESTAKISTGQGAKGAGRETQPASPGAMPPPPDAPAPQGRLLDYIEALKQKETPAEVKPEPEPAATPPAPAAAGPAQRGAIVSKPRQAEGSKLVPVGGVARRKAERPRRVRDSSSHLRPLLFKLLIGAGIAAAAVSVQENLKGRDTPAVREAKVAMTSAQPAAAPPAAVPAQKRETGSIARAADQAPPSVLAPKQLKGHPGGTFAVAYTDDGRSIVTVGADASLKVWDADIGALTSSIPLPAAKVTSLAVSGRRALTGHSDGTILLWDLTKPEKLGQFRRNESAIWSVAFAGSPSRFIAAGQDWTVALWDAQSTASPVFAIEGHDGAVQSVAFSEKGSLVASGGADRLVKLWDASTGQPVRTYRGHRDAISALAFSPDGRVIASAALDGTIRLWSLTSHRLYRAFAAHRGRISAVAFAPSGDQLASAAADGRLRVWDYRRSRAIRSFNDGAGGVKALAYSPDGRHLAAAGDDGAVRLWDLEQPLAMR